jgi:uncharacterized protein (TIGR02646 family)
MKHIKKGESPNDLLEWFEGQFIDGKYMNCRFKELDSDVKANIKQLLLQEQGWLCCYTGLTIESETSHFEHLFPQSLSKRRGTHEDIDYQNMMVAYPKDGKCDFGAKARENDLLPVHPLQPDCETKFKFDIEGGVSGIDDDSEHTIKLLKLFLLNDERKAAIGEILFPADVILNQEDFQIVADSYSDPDDNGRLRKFCFVVAYVAKELLNSL